MLSRAAGLLAPIVTAASSKEKSREYCRSQRPSHSAERMEPAAGCLANE